MNFEYNLLKLINVVYFFCFVEVEEFFKIKGIRIIYLRLVFNLYSNRIIDIS